MRTEALACVSELSYWKFWPKQEGVNQEILLMPVKHLHVIGKPGNVCWFHGTLNYRFIRYMCHDLKQESIFNSSQKVTCLMD